MFEKLSRSWELVKASAAVLRSDKELMLFPVLSGIATLVVLATFLLPMLALRVFADGFGIGGAVFGFLFYFCQYTVIIFFNCALVGAAMIRLDGGDPTLRDGFDAAKSRLPWSFSTCLAKNGMTPGAAVPSAQTPRYTPFASSSSSSHRETFPSGCLAASPGNRVFVLVMATSVCGNQ